MKCWTLTLLFIVACGPSGKGKSPPGPGSGGETPDAPPAVTVDAGPDPSCGAQTQMIGVKTLGDPPDLLVVLDRSGSMNDFAPFTFTPKWQLMRDALEQITAAKDQNIRFGLLEFPSDNNCAADAIAEVPI